MNLAPYVEYVDGSRVTAFERRQLARHLDTYTSPAPHVTNHRDETGEECRRATVEKWFRHILLSVEAMDRDPHEVRWFAAAWIVLLLRGWDQLGTWCTRIGDLDPHDAQRYALWALCNVMGRT